MPAHMSRCWMADVCCLDHRDQKTRIYVPGCIRNEAVSCHTWAAFSRAARRSSRAAVLNSEAGRPSAHSTQSSCGSFWSRTKEAMACSCRRSATSYVSVLRSSSAAGVRVSRRCLSLAPLISDPVPCRPETGPSGTVKVHLIPDAWFPPGLWPHQAWQGACKGLSVPEGWADVSWRV